MSLTHICIWDANKGYRHITLEEACNIPEYKYRTVRAEEGVFVCELCAQRVCLTAPGKQRRNFRHNSTSEKKECEDRAQIYARNKIQDDSHPVLPLRIEERQGSYLLSLGLFHDPSFNINGAQCPKVIITGDSGQKFVHSFERLSPQGITYLNVGNIPSTRYHLSYENVALSLSGYWPCTTEGIDGERGSFFDYSSGKMLQPGSKAYLNRDYYLLQRKRIVDVPYGISCESIAENRLDYCTIWRLYKIRAEKFSASVARFFLEHSVFLTEKPAEFYPVWPPYIEDPYFIYQNDLAIYFYFQANEAEFKITPYTYVQCKILEDGKLYKVYSKTKEQQLISLGQLGAIKSSYLMTKKLDMVAAFPEVQIKSIDGKAITEDLCNQLPAEKQIIIQTPFDGKIIIFRGNKITDIRHTDPKQDITIEKLAFGDEIQIFQGCDLVRTIKFVKLKQNTNIAIRDRQLVQQLCNCKGTMIPIYHNIATATDKLRDYHLTKKWVYSKIRRGIIARDAYALLLQYCRKMSE